MLTNKEINYCIGKIISPNGSSDVSKEGAHLQKDEILIHDYIENGLCVGWKKFDPCNNKQDAQNIIKKFSIEINKVNNNIFNAFCYIDGKRVEHFDDNALRAAMLVGLDIENSLKSI